jgi:hypothetical protein
MKITLKAANIYGYVAIVAMTVLLVLAYFEIVPRAWQWPLFGVAVALYLVRITLRLVLARQDRMEQQAKGAKPDGPAGEDTHS